MDCALKKYRARIFGDTYSIVSDEQEELILQAVKLVDSTMREAAGAHEAVDPKKVAVLTALKIALQVLHRESMMEQEKFLSNRIFKVLDKEEVFL